MSLESFKEMLKNLNGEYTFNFALEDDSAYFFEKFGGEERLKTKFPAIHQSYLKARESAMCRMEANGDEAGEDCLSDLSKIVIDKIGTGTSLCQLTATLNCAFIDNTKKVCSNEASSPWTGITIQTTVQDKFSEESLIDISQCLPATNSYNDNVLSSIEDYSDLQNRYLSTQIVVGGKDPAGKMNMKFFGGEQTVDDFKLYTIKNIKVNDPAPKNNKHRISNEIMMLYGRTDQQAIYADADYRDGDYLSNAFDAVALKVHLLLPISGEIILDCGVEPVGLYAPKTGEKLTRSKATYDYKDQSFRYRDDINDDSVLYDRLKDCFKKDPYQPAQLTSVKFDIRIPDTGRSDLDWHTDVEGVQNGDPKTIFFLGGFTYQVKNQLGNICKEQITIRSVTPADLAAIGRSYYDYKVGTNRIYIPPITIYWGCFGKDVMLKLFDGTEKSVKDIKPNDVLLGYESKPLVVENILTGKDTTIYQIKTQDREIQVSGGHPMMKEGKSVRASQLKAGDKLNLFDGSLAEIESIAVINYNDTVYNFTFVDEEEGHFIVANDFYSGDLKMQNQKAIQPEAELSLEDKQFIAEMLIHHNELKTGSLK